MAMTCHRRENSRPYSDCDIDEVVVFPALDETNIRSIARFESQLTKLEMKLEVTDVALSENEARSITQIRSMRVAPILPF